MYEHYERHRTDNITDPALRRAHPISTISGWDREHDQSADDAKAPNDKAAIAGGDSTGAAAVTAAGENENVPGKSYNKVSKSEQTDDTGDDDVIGLDQVKCACEENSNENGDKQESITQNSTTASMDANKPVQSISSISQVYNEQLTGQSTTTAPTATVTPLCNGDAEHHALTDDNDDDGGDDTPTKDALLEKRRTDGDGKAVPTNVTTTTSATDALRETLEIDSYDDDLNDVDDDDNKEIVDEIVEEILTKSETLLDDCKRSLDETQTEETTTSSPVIKDEEIEHAVSEVVAGVRNIERMVKRDSETDTVLVCDAIKNMSGGREQHHHHLHPHSNIDELVNDKVVEQEQCENQKTELEQRSSVAATTTNTTITTTPAASDSHATITDTLSETLIDVGSGETLALTEKISTNVKDGDDEIKDIVTTIVNDVIENCVNQTTLTAPPTTTTTTTTHATDNGNNNICDNDMNKMSIIDNINNNRNNNNTNIKRNSSDVANTNDSNDNAIIANDDNADADSVDVTIKQTAETTTATATIDVVNQRNVPTVETIEIAATPLVEETDEDIIKGIVNEIVDKCVVESETNAAHDNDNNNNSDGDAAGASAGSHTLNKSGNEVFNANDDGASDQRQQQMNAKFTSADNSDDNRTSKLNRSSGTSISTSTQVENNHFGKFSCCFPVKMLKNASHSLLFLTQLHFKPLFDM